MTTQPATAPDAAHTPGPFTHGPVSHRAESASETFERFTCDVFALNSQSSVCGQARYFKVYGVTRQECEANADLIANSARLTAQNAALVKALESISEGDVQPGHVCYLSKKSMAEQARAALALAKGGK